MKMSHTRVKVPTRADGSLRLGVVADTHSAPHPKALTHLAALAPDAILHAGDIGALSVLSRLEEIAPLYAIRGNIDEHAPGLSDVLTIDITRDEDVVRRILLLHIGVNGPRLRADAKRLARAEDAALVICGHSHIPLIARDDELAIFNPGSVGPRRFQLPIVFGAVNITSTSVDLAHYHAETGERWSPGTRRREASGRV